MKKTILFCIAILFVATAFCQESNSAQKTSAPNGGACPKVYLGFSTGLNNESGIMGVNIDVPIGAGVSVGAGAGLSTWGSKIYGEVRYYLGPCQRGWAFGAGLSHNTGLTGFKPNMETVYGNETVTMNLNAQSNAFIKVYRFWNLGRGRNRFYTALGFSIPLTTPSYDQTGGDQLSDNSKNAMKLLEPGGLVFSLGFSFGLH